MPTTCVWLDGLAPNITEQYLTRHFCRYGHVVKVKSFAVFNLLKCINAVVVLFCFLHCVNVYCPHPSYQRSNCSSTVTCLGCVRSTERDGSHLIQQHRLCSGSCEGD